ncbi:Diaminopimelate epimerase-like protein [Hypoxylon sp. FL0890]|nr:Diaminopimelate epimerase-like protein [Hypoxylon sp. FL0890]
MTDLQFVTLDVFTSTRLQGNPLAVVTVPASLKDKLSQATKQKIAQEFNLSETVFLHEAADSDSQQQQRNVDIFTIEREIPFAGHPTIGTAVLVKYHLHPHVDTLVTKAGPIGLASQADNQIRAKIPHNVHLHSKTLADVIGGNTAYPGLCPVPQIRDAELKAPVFSVVNGMTFVLVKLPSLDLLGQVGTSYRLDFDALPQPLLDEGWRDSLVCRYYYVDLGEEDGEKRIRSRMVELGFEDPATGSAATALGSYLTLNEEKRGTRFRVTQGVEMGRKSDISVETTVRGSGSGGVELEELWLGGTAVVVLKGSLTVDI